MTENGLDIQTISTKRPDFQTDRILLLGQVTDKKEKAYPSQSQKSHFFFQRTDNGYKAVQAKFDLNLRHTFFNNNYIQQQNI